MHKSKISAEEKLSLIKKYKRREGSVTSLAKAAGVDRHSFRAWLRNYDACGADVFGIVNSFV